METFGGYAARVRLDRIEAFVAVCEEGHFGRAAERLGRSTSAVSKEVSALEATFGVRLLERTSRRVGLTHAGAQMLEPARQLLAAARACDELGAKLAVGTAGVVRAAYAISCFEFLEELIADCAAVMPGIEFEVDERRPGGVLADVIAGKADLGLAWGAQEEPGIERQMFERLVLSYVVVPSDHPVAAQDSVRRGDLDGERFLLSRDSDPYVPQLRACAAALGEGISFRPEPISTRDSYTDKVRMGMGITITNAKSAPLYAARGVAVVPIGDPELWGYIDQFVFWRADNDSPALRRVIERIRALLAPGVRMVLPGGEATTISPAEVAARPVAPTV